MRMKTQKCKPRIRVLVQLVKWNPERKKDESLHGRGFAINGGNEEDINYLVDYFKESTVKRLISR